MPKRPLKNSEQDRPKGSYTASLIPYYAYRVDELPFLTFSGKTPEDARLNMLAELTRRNPQGFDLETRH